MFLKEEYQLLTRLHPVICRWGRCFLLIYGFRITNSTVIAPTRKCDTTQQTLCLWFPHISNLHINERLAESAFTTYGLIRSQSFYKYAIQYLRLLYSISHGDSGSGCCLTATCLCLNGGVLSEFCQEPIKTSFCLTHLIPFRDRTCCYKRAVSVFLKSSGQKKKKVPDLIPTFRTVIQYKGEKYEESQQGREKMISHEGHMLLWDASRCLFASVNIQLC